MSDAEQAAPRQGVPDSPQGESETPRRRRLALALKIARWVVIVAVAVCAVWYFASMWSDVAPALSRMTPLWLALSFLVLLVGMAMNVAAWVTLLRGLGHPVPMIRGSQIMLVGQLGKYVPGSVWAYLLQMELGRQYGVARARVLVTSLYAAGVGVVASLMLSVVVLPQIAAVHPAVLWLLLLLPVGLACLHPVVMTYLANLVLRLFRREPLEHRVRLSTTLGALAWTIGSYLLYGVHLWLLGAGEAHLQDIPLLAAAIGMGFTVSLLAFVLPSGIGVREAVLIAALSLVISTGDASAIALVSRAMFTAGDLLTAGAAAVVAFLLHRQLHRADAATTEYPDVAA